MKSYHLYLFAGLLAVSAAFGFRAINRAGNKGNTNTVFALVELYTSEGCSSCPPADILLAKIAQEYNGKEVYVLAYHVDYWNHLGWKDAFSSPQYAQRQRSYSSYLKLDGVYTPQAIVNGKTEFVGSDEAKMNAAITQNLHKAAAQTLMLTNVKITGNKATLQYHLSGGKQGADNLQLAIVQKHAQTQVKAGENSGRMLPHINIVQKLQAISLKSDNGNAEISLPDGFNAKDWAIIGFVQSTRNGEILAAQKAPLEGAALAAVN